MDTKLKGDIAEQAIILKGLQLGFEVLQPIGDRLPYDLVFATNKDFFKIQVKSAWFDATKGNYVVDNRKTKTNQKNISHTSYLTTDFDFAILYIEELNVFYILPIADFLSYGSEIHLVETDKRQRKPRSAKFRENWALILDEYSSGNRT